MNIKFLTLFLTLLISQSCANDDVSIPTFQGCDKEREPYQEVVDIEGTVEFFDDQKVYAFRYIPEIPEEEGVNIDSVIYALVCDLDSELKQSGKVIVFSGTLSVLTEDEKNRFEPIPAGTEIYILDYTKLLSESNAL